MFGKFNKRRPAARQSHKPRLGIARLEDRSTPSVAASVVGGTLFVSGSASQRGAEIRIAGSDGQVQVFDGTMQVAAFKGVTGVNARPDAGNALAINLGTNRDVNDLTVRLGDATISDRADVDAGARLVNAVRIDGGAVDQITVTGNAGNDQVSLVGVSAGQIAVDLGAGADDVMIAKSAAKVVTVQSAESVRLLSDAMNTVTVYHPNGAAAVTMASTVEGNVDVSTRGGSLTLGGTVRGDVNYLAEAPPTMKPVPAKTEAAALYVTGQVLGSLHMYGTTLGDAVEFAPGSRVARNLTLDLGMGNDAVTFAGEVGDGQTSALAVNLGDGDDSVQIKGTARLQAAKASIDLGAGNDRAAVADGATLARLHINGGAGNDTFRRPAAGQRAVQADDFETVE